MLRSYYLAKILKKLQISSFDRCEIDPTARVSSGGALARVVMGRFSYVGANAHITDARIGSFCSIGGGVSIGGGEHPMDAVSTSPVFLRGRNLLRTNFAGLPYEPSRTVAIGHDVWIGSGAFIRGGVSIGTGAVIGAHAVVLSDVPPYTVAAGVPARTIRQRFDPQTVQRLLALRWWEWPEDKLRRFGADFASPQRLFEALDREERPQS